MWCVAMVQNAKTLEFKLDLIPFKPNSKATGPFLFSTQTLVENGIFG